MKPPNFVLASASVARKRLLQSVGIDPIISKSGFDESTINHDDPVELVNTLAQCKAEIVAKQFTDALVLGCDSLLSVGGEIHGKPETKTEAIARWQQMTGQQGNLYTGHCLIAPGGEQILHCGVTQVYFGAIALDTIKAYVDSGEPLNCAGAFALEGKGGLLVDRLEGCHSNVIGLSLPLLRQMLQDLGYPLTLFWD
ncbi:MAG: septum formation inhibitor Maf [Gloeocapsa sp. DLM2.Bin57]|nr:MAG: septum formation inhibitor Maf [Gloeocapsa sp. DLM2.Bin57]